MSDGPVELPGDWPACVNRAETGAELEALRTCLARGRPFGGRTSLLGTVQRLGPESALLLRLRGRPRNKPKTPEKPRQQPEQASGRAI